MNRPVPVLESRPPRSVPAPPDGLTFQWERLPNIARELPPLFKRHYEELATERDRIPLDPNWDQYFDLALVNVLHILTARAGGTLVGYAFMIVHPGLHYASTLQAEDDLYWLDPVYRQGWNGVRMFREVIAGMKKIGVKRLFIREKYHHERDRGGVGKILKRMGFQVQDVVYAKYIG